jgi:hypothetical protein
MIEAIYTKKWTDSIYTKLFTDPVFQIKKKCISFKLGQRSLTYLESLEFNTVI